MEPVHQGHGVLDHGTAVVDLIFRGGQHGAGAVVARIWVALAYRADVALILTEEPGGAVLGAGRVADADSTHGDAVGRTGVDPAGRPGHGPSRPAVGAQLSVVVP